MPTYTYKCKKCEHETDIFHSMKEVPRVKCESCGSTRTFKLLGTGAGIIFKGSGFYATDYKKESKQKTEKSESKSETKTESKAAAKSETKSADKSAGAKSD